MTTAVISPAQRAFEEDLDDAPYLAGLDRGWWRYGGGAWPHAHFEVTAADRAEAPPLYAFRFELSQYLGEGPTAELWDSRKDGPLAIAEWPSGGEATVAFNPDWQNGQAIYIPTDRRSIPGHPDWKQNHPELIWSADVGITQYLRALRGLLNDEEYSGVRG